MINRIFENSELTGIFTALYGSEEKVSQQIQRYSKLIDHFQKKFKQNDFFIFSTPGRTEMGGNHTDHNHGRVLAASVDLDSIAVVNSNSADVITLISEGFDQPFVVKLSELELKDNESGTTLALIRGIAARFKELGYNIGGFDALITSNVFSGSGLSSSASIEVLIGSILNGLYNQNKIDPVELAKIGQYAENVYFKKPCGLMDQIACAVGGIVTIDFRSVQEPVVLKVDFDFSQEDYNVVVVDTGGNHADLTDDYASIPAEMKSVAQTFNQEVCRDLTEEQLLTGIKNLREQCGDRAVLRAMHFINENERVVNQVEALNKKDFSLFLKYVIDSGNSSWKWLQNCFTVKQPDEQGVCLALAVTENFIEQLGEGACRVHGGGFAGTIQCFLPNHAIKDYKKRMEQVLSPDAVTVLNIRPIGTTQIWPLVN